MIFENIRQTKMILFNFLQSLLLCHGYKQHDKIAQPRCMLDCCLMKIALWVNMDKTALSESFFRN